MDNTNTGSLFKNDKGDNPKRPDYRGSLNCGGVEYWVSGWIREAGPNTKRAGEKFMSLSLEPKEERPAQDPKAHPVEKPATIPTGGAFADMQDDIPF